MVTRGERHISIDLRDLYDPASVPIKLDRGLFTSNAEYAFSIANGRANAVRKNFATVYAYIYQALLGGKIAPHGPRQGNGSFHGAHYHPDVVHILRNPRGRIDVEIKSFSSSTNGSAACYVSQFENYIARLLGRVSQGTYSAGGTDMRYAFFRYKVPTERMALKGHYTNGARRKRDVPLVRLANIARGEFLDFLGEHTRDLLIAPPNLLTLLFANAADYHHSSSNGKGSSGIYRHVKSGDLSKLHRVGDKGRSGVESLLVHHHKGHQITIPGMEDEHMIGVLKPQDLMFDRMQVRQEESPRIIVNGKHEFRPFIYTAYDFKSPKDRTAWNRFLSASSKDILVKTLRVRDLHSEVNETVPI